MTTPYNPFTIQGKTILVTGASSGIGRATALECSKMGAAVMLTGRNAERLQQTCDELAGPGHQLLTADLNDQEQLDQLVAHAPQLDGVVHAAGVAKTLPFEFSSRTELEHIFNINFYAPVLLTQQLVKKRKFAKNASIVFIASIDGPITAHIGNAQYSASKGAITAIAKNMAVELAAKKIRVNCVLPGMTETPLIHGGGITQEQLDADRKLYPLKRYGRPEEIAHAAIFFLSDASAWATGSSLVIDGGFTLL